MTETTENEFRERFYPRQRQSIPAARQFSVGAVADWGFFHRLDDVLLCVSELATNALVHGVPPGRGFLLRLELCDGAVFRVEVHDSGGGVPRVADRADVADEGGRGLLLVAALADKWGVGERDPGKVVWCEFVCPGGDSDGGPGGWPGAGSGHGPGGGSGGGTSGGSGSGPGSGAGGGPYADPCAGPDADPYAGPDRGMA
ncbi:ATP-binding protein [Streptomyces sp. NPDC050485]|uniref:ATP-binding protein n=1 Tax=Streptomyces sp. NPDC050485 TaxID=3365617 RepID=UPI0037A3EAC7